VSAVYKPSRIARRTDASIRCLSVALVKPHHAGDAYNSLERAWFMTVFAMDDEESCFFFLHL